MNSPTVSEGKRNRIVSLVIAGGLVAVYFAQLGSHGLIEPDEGRYAEIGREMAAEDGDWLIPKLNGIPHFQKPPVIYWLTAVSLKVFGVSEFSARLPSALSAIGVLLLTTGISRRLFGGPDAPVFSLVILVSAPLFLFLGRALTPDMTMTFWITASIFCLVRSRADDLDLEEPGVSRFPPLLWGWLFFVCMGIGFLTKGPVAFLVPISAALGYAIAIRESDRRLQLPWLWGLPLALAIGLSWFLAVSVKHPGLADYFLKHELIDRFGSNAHGRSKPFWFFVPVILAGFLPWTFLGLRLLPTAIRSRSGPGLWLFAGWIVLPLLVLSLSGSKLPTYVLPLFPGLAVALGGGLAFALRSKLRLSLTIRILTGLCLLTIAGLPLFIPSFFPESAPGVSAWDVGSFLGPALLVIVWGTRSSGMTRGTILSLGAILLLTWSTFPPRFTAWNDLFEQQASVKTLAARILSESEGQPDPPRVIACEIRAHGLEFYLGRTVEMIRSDADLILPAFEVSTLHRNPSKVALLRPGAPGDSLFVVTRKARYRRDFAPNGWETVQTAGDFVLLRR